MLNISDFKDAERVFYYFEEISKIPHGSGNTGKIADYLTDFASAHGLFVFRDESDNILIRKPATAGYEDRPPVIIQGHTDMVAEKTPDSCRDMQTQGIEIIRDGDFLKAKDSTLGGDDGIAIAYALAILESNDIPHPALEVLLTSDEEIGLLGAAAFDKSLLQGRMLLNIDSDEEGIFTAGCAGGVRTDVNMQISREATEGKGYRLTVSGLLGGHSGVEIGKGRANAIKLGFRILTALPNISLVSATGGNMDNAIPREFTAEFVTEEDISEAFDSAYASIMTEFADREPDLTVSVTPANIDALPACRADSAKMLSIANAIPFGPTAMNAELPDLVETSLNTGIVRLDESFRLCTSIRSSVEAEKEKLVQLIAKIAEHAGAEFTTRGSYPGWAYRKDSALRDACVSVYNRLYGGAEVITIHAGLECGLFSDAIEGLDCISFGPNNYDIHTTEERLSISSTVRVWEFLLEVLKNI